jgi:DNA-binding response OmpR family regulator
MAGKLLIIEDDPTAMRLIEYALKQRGYQVLTTRNGLEGIITAQKEEPDLIILDIMLPGIYARDCAVGRRQPRYRF